MLISKQKPMGRSSERGFTLLEVMVSVMVVAVGLLGIAKMQALAIASTHISSGRSLVALEASSLASSMHAGKAYWAAGVAPASFTITGKTISDAVLSSNVTNTDCTSTSLCAASKLAALDVQQWAANMSSQFPSHVTTVTCSTSTGAPISCKISVNWTEKAVTSVNQTATANAPAAANTQNYVLYVEP